MNNLKKIYCFCNTRDKSERNLEVLAMTEEAEVIACHTCSDIEFCKKDIGILTERKHDIYNSKFGVGNWELIWIDDVENSEILQKIFNKIQDEEIKNNDKT